MKAKCIIVLTVILLFSLIIAPCAFADAADDEKITVYITISKDGDFVRGKDGTVMAHVPFEISYFDLAEYGLSNYYRYEAAPFEDGGEYISTRIIKEPTLLHLYIKVLEKYCAGRKLTAEDMHSDIIDITGSPTHVFLERFWNHNFNLMYFVDHEFPLQAKGWGATCDYILLYDGTEIDLAMFSDMGFHTTGAFVSFDSKEYTVMAGEELVLTMLGTETKDGGGEVNAPVKNEPIRISDDYGRTWATNVGSTDDKGKITISFDAPGTYYISAGPVMENYPSLTGMPDTAPPISIVTVTPEEDAVPVSNVDIEAGSLYAPDIGEALQETTKCSGVGVKQTIDITWYDETGKYLGNPIPGHAYRAELRLKPEAGYKLTRDTTVTLGDDLLPVKSVGEDGTVTVSKIYDKLPGSDKDPSEETKTVRVPNTLKVKLLKKNWIVKARTIKKRAKRIKAVKITKAKGRVTYSISGNRRSKKTLKFNKKDGIVTVRKGARKGLYKLKIKVKASGAAGYLPKTKIVTIRIRVK